MTRLISTRAGYVLGGVSSSLLCTSLAIRILTPALADIWGHGGAYAAILTALFPPAFALSAYLGVRRAAALGRTIDTPHLHGTYLGLEGGFRLETLPDGRTKLIGFSRYSLNLAPNVYWSPWTRLIVRKVHLHVMSHVKAESEGNKATVR